MKNQIINTLVAVIFTVASVFATNSDPSITSAGTKSFVINNTDWKSEFVDVTISDRDGLTVYSNRENLVRSKKFSLENLRSGDYTVIISNEIKTVENNITITDSGLFIDNNVNTTFKPVFKVSKNNIDVNYYAAGQDTKVIITQNNSIVFQQKLDAPASITKRYNTTSLPSGDYSIIVSNENASFSKNFSK